MNASAAYLVRATARRVKCDREGFAFLASKGFDGLDSDETLRTALKAIGDADFIRFLVIIGKHTEPEDIAQATREDRAFLQEGYVLAREVAKVGEFGPFWRKSFPWCEVPA